MREIRCVQCGCVLHPDKKAYADNDGYGPYCYHCFLEYLGEIEESNTM